MAVETASCWICLEEGLDESGQPLRRDCSCRGKHAGFAHLSCLIKYAESKCKQLWTFKASTFVEPWGVCQNCKQPFQNELAMDLSVACVSFAEKAYGYGGDCFVPRQLMLMEALLFASRLIVSNPTDVDTKTIDDGVRHVNRLHSMVEQAIKDHGMKSWVHMPKTSKKFRVYKLLRVRFEASAHDFMGGFLYNLYHRNDDIRLIKYTRQEATDMILRHYQKARTIFKLFNEEACSNRVELRIAAFKEELGLKAKDPEITIARCRALYDERIQKEGSESEATIYLGLTLGATLGMYNRIAEAKGLATELNAVCHRVHGREHNLTEKAEALLSMVNRMLKLEEEKCY